MRTKLIESNKPEKYIHSVRNADTTTQAQTIAAGTPLILNLSATPQPPTYSNSLPAGWEDGLQVVLPSTAGANAALFVYGVAIAPIIYPQLGETQVHGVGIANVVRATRAGTSGTNSWAAGASSACFGSALSVDTGNNAFTIGAAASVSNQFVMLDNQASYAGSATNTSDTRTALVVPQRVFIKVM